MDNLILIGFKYADLNYLFKTPQNLEFPLGQILINRVDGETLKIPEKYFIYKGMPYDRSKTVHIPRDGLPFLFNYQPEIRVDSEDYFDEIIPNKKLSEKAKNILQRAKTKRNLNGEYVIVGVNYKGEEFELEEPRISKEPVVKIYVEFDNTVHDIPEEDFIYNMFDDEKVKYQKHKTNRRRIIPNAYIFIVYYQIEGAIPRIPYGFRHFYAGPEVCMDGVRYKWRMKKYNKIGYYRKFVNQSIDACAQTYNLTVAEIRQINRHEPTDANTFEHHEAYFHHYDKNKILNFLK